MLKQFKGELRAANRLKNEPGERDREVGNLNSKLLNPQLDIKSLHAVCKRQGKTLQENKLCVEEAMINTSHGRHRQLLLTSNKKQPGSIKQCHLRQLQQLKKKLLALQQELEIRTQELQTSYCSLLRYQSILEKQTSDLVLLHHHCKLKEDEVILYEEEMGNHNENMGEKFHLAQEKLALEGDKIVSLERSLNLYSSSKETYSQLLQDKDEMLHELEKKLTQVQDSLMKKELEPEKQQCMMKDLKVTIKEAKQDKSKVEYEVLRNENQKLKNSCEEIRQLQTLGAQNAAQNKEKAWVAGCNLEGAQRKIQSCILLEKQKEESIQELQNQVQKLQKDLGAAEEARLCSRKQIEDMTSELAGVQKKLVNSEKEKQQLRKTLDEEEKKVNNFLDHARLIQQQQRELLNAKSELEEELREVKKSLEKKQEQLKKSKEQEKLLEEETETLREAKQKEKMAKENLRKLEEEKETLQADLKYHSIQLELFISKYNSSQKIIQDLNVEINCQKDTLMSLQTKLEIAIQKEKSFQNMVTKEVYEDICRKLGACQDDLTQALEKLNHATSETKSLQRSLQQTQERKSQLEDEIMAYEDRMKKFNVEFKKLQGFHKESELEVRTFDKKLEEMSNQVLQWQKQHQNDLRMLAAKETQLREFQEEMATLKEILLADEKEPCCLPSCSAPKDTYRLHQENDQIMCDMEQWTKEQKVANEKLGNKLREQVKYIAKLTGEKDHLHNIIVHLQQENRKLKNEIEEKMKTGSSYC
ncbi:polyamine-modulated factor 1-binding protein 1 [Nannospalax galili]|uniref:polyamine-modulated factor 1-binding protein 1 n=1 Tax=Nannospalax galili TaxID=1026970 RepID=UPI0004ED019F|nr:polyamine-modulated factor 1-binding protein 1 [Nannospalax galili]